MIKRILGAAFVSASLLAGSAWGHHSLAGVYDIRGSGQITGIVKKVEFINPHGVLTVTVDNEDGTKTDWQFTTGSANVLSNLGIGRGGPNNVLEGDTITIAYMPARNGKPLGFIRSITLPNATTIEIDPD